MVDDQEDLDAAEQKALPGVGARWSPPVELREQTRAALREQGLLGPPARPGRLGRWVPLGRAAAAAVLALAFIGGFAVGRRGAAPPTAPEGDRYMLLLYENDAYQAPQTREESHARAREYGDWAREIAMSGRMVDGNELSAEARWYRPAAGGMESATPVVDPERGNLAGYFIVGAADAEDAAAVTSGCPHLRYGGTIEIRRIGSS
jgi:hypothetical protein